MNNILMVFGTRPEVIKLFPVIIQLQQAGHNVILCNTEQQKELSNQTLDMFELKSDYNLSVMRPNQSLAGTQARILTNLENIVSQNKFDAIIVQGDTLSAFCGALNGFYNHIPVFHIEAGLRTNDIEEPFPEEAFRQMIACISTLHFTPSIQAKNNLLREGISKEIVHVTGNTIVDTLEYYKQNLKSCSERKLQDKKIQLDNKNILVTVHRRENHLKMHRILSAIKKVALNFPQFREIVLVHPNPNVGAVIRQELSNIKNVLLLDPLNYDELIGLMCQSALIMTDSGGIQEEAAYLGIPTVILRDKTERQEILKYPNIRLAGTNPDDIYTSAVRFLNTSEKSTCRRNIYGTGKAAEKIIHNIDAFFSSQKNEHR